MTAREAPEEVPTTVVLKGTNATGTPYNVYGAAGDRLLVDVEHRPFVVDPARPGHIVPGPEPSKDRFIGFIDASARWVSWFETEPYAELTWTLYYASLKDMKPVEIASGRSDEVAKPMISVHGDDLIYFRSVLDEDRNVKESSIEHLAPGLGDRQSPHACHRQSALVGGADRVRFGLVVGGRPRDGTGHRDERSLGG